jgi:ribosomal protein S13
MGSGVGVHSESKVKHLTDKERKQLRDHVAKQAFAQIRRLINSDPTVLKHLAKHKGIRAALQKASASKLKPRKKKK